MAIEQKSRPLREHNFKDKIFYKSDVLSKQACAELIQQAKQPNSGLHRGIAKHNMWHSAFWTTQLPVNHAVHAELQTLWSEIIEFYNFKVDFVEQYEIKCYDINDYFDYHTDINFSLTNALDRKITLSITLNDEYHGGELQLIDGYSVPSTVGSCIAFPSFFRHAVSPVEQGQRWSLIGWAWGPEWQ